MRIALLVWPKACLPFENQTIAVDGIEPLAGVNFAQPILLHGGEKKICDADSCRTKSEEPDPLLLHGYARRRNSSQNSCGRNCRRPLDVIVEGTELITISREKAPSI